MRMAKAEAESLRWFHLGRSSNERAGSHAIGRSAVSPAILKFIRVGSQSCGLCLVEVDATPWLRRIITELVLGNFAELALHIFS